jgi:hypothetical protein
LSFFLCSGQVFATIFNTNTDPYALFRLHQHFNAVPTRRFAL